MSRRILQSCDDHPVAQSKMRYQVVSQNLVDDLQPRKYKEGRLQEDFDFSPESLPDGYLFNPLID